MPGEFGFRNYPRYLRQRMLPSGNHQEHHRGQPFGGKGGRNQWQRTHDAKTAAAVEYRLNGPTQRFDVKPQRCARELMGKFLGGLGKGEHGKHHIGDHRQFRLEPSGHPLGARLE